MTLTGMAHEIAADVSAAMSRIRVDVEQSTEGLKALHAKRLGSDQHKAAWERAERGYKTAAELYRRLGELYRQLSAISNGKVTLGDAEIALFAYGEIGGKIASLPDMLPRVEVKA